MNKKILLVCVLVSGSLGFYRTSRNAPTSVDEVSVTTTNHYCDSLEANESSSKTVQTAVIGNQADIAGSTDSSKEFVGMFVDGYLNTAAHSGSKKVRIKAQDTSIDNYYCNSGSNTIIFVDNNNRYLDSITLEDGETLEQEYIDYELADLSTAVAGYTLDSNFYLGETVFTSSTSIENSVILKTKLVYDDDYKTYQVGVNGPTATVSNTAEGTAGYYTDVKFDKMVTLNSTSDDFSYWKVGDRILSYEKEYSFSVYIDTFVEEVTDGTVTDKQPLINLYHDERISDMDNLYEIGFSVPGGCEVVETGMLFGGKTYEEAANKVVANSISSNNEYAVKYNGDDKDNHVAYLITKQNDEITITYDDGFGYEQLLMYGLSGNNGTSISSDTINSLITYSGGEVSTSVGVKAYSDASKNGSRGTLLKLGSSSASGSITVNMPAGTQANKAEVSCLGWDSNEVNVSIGGNTTDGLNYDSNIFSMATSEFTAADSVTITSTSRVMIEAINVYYTSDSESTEVTPGDDTGDTSSETTSEEVTSEEASSEETSSEGETSSGDLPTDVQTYYSEVNFNQDAENLKTALFSLINDHTDCGYNGLYTIYEDSDVAEDGTVYDIYSSYEHTTDDFGGNYKNEGDVLNREHTVPQSWFNEASPYKSDAFHVFPSDGKVNGYRSSYQYGEVDKPSNARYTSTNGCMLGENSSGTTIFEVCDDYKGDIARAYFYMATCYQNVCGNWGNAFSNSNYTKFTDYTLDLMTKWNREDPVSQRDIDRNNGIFKHQHNRNPYIDFPELGEEIFG